MTSKGTTSTGPTRRHDRHDGARALERLRRLCTSLPGVVEKTHHDRVSWCVGAHEKVFARFDHDARTAEESVSIATTRQIRDFLVGSDPRAYFVPPEAGEQGWTGVVLAGSPDWNVIDDLVQAAFASTNAARSSMPPRGTQPPPSRRNTRAPAAPRKAPRARTK